MTESRHDDVDAVVPGVMNTLAAQVAPRRPTRRECIVTILVILLLVGNVVSSAVGLILTQLHNSCQNTSTQRLRDANASDRNAQDTLDSQYQKFIDSLMGAPSPDPTARRRIYDQEQANYAQFKQVRAQNELIRASTTRRC